MATKPFCFHLNWFRYLSFSAYLSLFIVLGCSSSKTPKAKPIYVDAIYAEAIISCATVYNKRFNQAIEIIQRPEKGVINALLNDSTKLVITLLEVDTNLQKIFAAKGFTLQSSSVFYSALVAIGAQKRVFNPTKLSMVYQLKEDQNLSNQLSNIYEQSNYGFENISALLQRLSVDSQAVGIIDLYTLQNFKRIGGWPYKDAFHVLPALQKGDTVFPNYGAIASGKYPYFRSVNFINKPGQITDEERFLRFLFEKEGQLILVKEGFIPVRAYPKTLKFK